jgi:hypothetical protein
LEIAHRAAEKVGPVRKVIVARIAQEEKIAHRAWGALMPQYQQKIHSPIGLCELYQAGHAARRSDFLSVRLDDR